MLELSRDQQAPHLRSNPDYSSHDKQSLKHIIVLGDLAQSFLLVCLFGSLLSAGIRCALALCTFLPFHSSSASRAALTPLALLYAVFRLRAPPTTAFAFTGKHRIVLFGGMVDK